MPFLGWRLQLFHICIPGNSLGAWYPGQCQVDVEDSLGHSRELKNYRDSRATLRLS